MKRLFSFFAAMAATVSTLMSVCACDDNKGTDEPGPDPIVNRDFTFETKSLTQGSFEVKIIPNDKSMTYYYGLTSKAAFDALGGAEILMEKDLENIAAIANRNGMTIPELLEQNLASGDRVWGYQALTPKTDYLFYAYGLNIQGEATTSMNLYEFTTPEPVFTDATFEISATNITKNSFDLMIVPSDPDCFWFYNVLTASEYEEFCGSDPANLKDYTESYFDALRSSEAYAGMTMAGFIDLITHRGTLKPESESAKVVGLAPESDYYVYAIGVANDGTFTTDATVKVISTIASPKNTYRVSVLTLSDTNFTTVVDADEAEPFVTLLVLKEYFKDNMTDDEIVNELYAAYKNVIPNRYLHSSTAKLTFDKLIPDDDYYLFIFAANPDGTPKTGDKVNLLKYNVHTQPAKASSVSYNISVSGITESSAHVKFNMSPYTQTETFMFNYLTKAEYDAMADKEAGLKEHMNKFWQSQYESWKKSNPSFADAPMKEFMSRYLLDGVNSLDAFDLDGLKTNTSYVVYCFGMKADGTFTTNAFTKEFSTLDDARCMAYLSFGISVTNNNTSMWNPRNTMTYLIFLYPNNNDNKDFDSYYVKTFSSNDEWAGKGAAEIESLLKQEKKETDYSNIYKSFGEFDKDGDKMWAYAVIYDKNMKASNIYKVEYTVKLGASTESFMLGKKYYKYVAADGSLVDPE